MKMTENRVRCIGVAAFATLAGSAFAVTMQLDPTSTVSLSTSTDADNGANGFGPPDDDSDTGSVSTYGPTANGAEAAVSRLSRDFGAPSFDTSASASALARLEDLGTNS